MSSPATTAVRIIVYTVFLSYADEYYFRSESKYRPELETLQYVVSEHTDNGTLIADIMKDARLRQLVAPEAVNRLYFRFLSTPPAGAPMSIDAKSGMMRTAGEIDREAVKQCRRVDPCRLPVDVAIGPAPYFRVVRVSVEIADINDNAPYFQQSAAIIRVRESASAGSSYALPVLSLIHI